MKHFSFLLFFACLLAGCLNFTHKPLMGGIASNAPKEEQKQASTQQKSDPKGTLEIPAPLKDRAEQILRRAGYTVSYNKDLRIPNWVAWHLTADHTSGPYKRGGIPFQEDMDVPTPRANTYDYQRSGYDRGHMCPSADNKWDEQAQQDCFLFTNMCPQDHNLNEGDWNEMEIQCRKWAEEYGDIYIVCGPILYRSKHKTIGQNRITVPEAFFKVVLCMQGTPKAIGFIYKNEPGNRPKGDYVNSIDQIERITGIDFFPSLPDDVEKAVESEEDLNDW
jgi:endonuclease G, mitochondrial